MIFIIIRNLKLKINTERGGEHMKKSVAKLICKFGTPLRTAASVVAPMVSDTCKNKYYQPEEPAGLEAFVKSQKEN